MKRLLSALLIVAVALSLALPVVAGDGSAPASTAEKKKIFHWDFEDGNFSPSATRSGQIAEVRGESPSKYLAYGLVSYADGNYFQLHSRNFTGNAELPGARNPYYFNSQTLVLSFSVSGGADHLVGSGDLEFKSPDGTGNVAIYMKGNELTAPGGAVIGTIPESGYLNVSCAITLAEGVAPAFTYFVDGEKICTASARKVADKISYFSLYIDGDESNNGRYWKIDNLSLYFGEVTEQDTAFFENLFKVQAQPTPEPEPEPEPEPTPEPEPGEEDEELSVGVPPTDETVSAIVVLDFENGDANGYGNYRTQCAAVVTDPVSGNKYLKFYNGGSGDLYYHFDSNKAGTGNYKTDPTMEKYQYYFDSDKLISSMRLSRGAGAVTDFTYEVRSPGAAARTNLFTVGSNGVVKTLGKATLGTIKEGEWLEIAVEIDLLSSTVTYWVNRKEALTEPITAALTKISYFNFASSNVTEGEEVYLDDLYYGYGDLHETFYMLRVDYYLTSGQRAPLYYGTDFLLPDDAPYWIGTVNGVKRVLPAGTRIKLAADLSFSAFTPDVELLAGAGIRIDGYHTGLRFEMTSDRASYDELVVAFGASRVRSGVLIVPTDYLADGTAFTHEALSEKYAKLADAQNRRWHDDSTAEHYVGYGTLTNLLPQNYKRTFSARAYICITYTDGTEIFLYADYDEAKHSRSAYDVALAAYADTAAGYTEEQRAIIRRYIDGE